MSARSRPNGTLAATRRSHAAFADMTEASRGEPPSPSPIVHNGRPDMRPSTATGNGDDPGRPAHHLSRAGSIASIQPSPSPSIRPKPNLLRSKSDHVARTDDQDLDQDDEEIYNWGARHGFEDHYQSEDIISQLANVSVLHIFTPVREWAPLTRPVLSSAPGLVYVLHR